MTTVTQFALMTAGLLAVFGGLEVLVRRGHLGSEWGRRASHVAACVYAIGIYTVLHPWWFVVVAATFTVAMVVSKLLNLIHSIHGTRRSTWGEVYLPLGLGLTAVITGQELRAFVVAALVLGLADVAAGVVGDLRGSPVKTWGGSIACLVVTGAIFLGARAGVPLSLVAAVAVAAVERISPRGLDNVTMPLLSAALLLTFE